MSHPPPPPPSGDPQYPQHPQQNPQPYGQQPPQQPYPPYGQQPPNPYGPQQTGKSHTTRNVLLIVGVLVVLFCGGVVGLGIWAFNTASDGIDSAFDTEYEGSEDDPVEVDEGDSFSIRGFDYGDGWSVNTDTTTQTVTIDDLVVTNNRDDEESYSLFLTVSFYSDGQGVGELTCSSPTTVRYEKKAEMSCTGYDVPSDFDSLEIFDNATFE